jgi:hypothetical protein
VHGIVLAGQSGYFKSLLQNWMASGSHTLSLTVSEEELPAAKAMLVAAYANSVPKDADPDQLLATMVLADRCENLLAADTGNDIAVIPEQLGLR